MTRFADPGRCPDCGAPIVPGSAACAACGLSLRGEDAAVVFSTLAQADALLVRLRTQSPGPAPPRPRPRPRPDAAPGAGPTPPRMDRIP